MCLQKIHTNFAVLHNSKEIQNQAKFAHEVTLSFIKERQLAESLLNNLCFLKMESKEVCLCTHVLKFFKGNIHHGNKLTLSPFFVKYFQTNYIWYSTTLLEGTHGQKITLTVSTKAQNAWRQTCSCYNDCLTKRTKY